MINKIYIFILFLFILLIFSSYYDKFTNLKVNKKNKKLIIVRIIGNSLPRINDYYQNFDNLEYILNNESNFPNCEKIWILNRIIDNNLLNKYKKLLNKNGKKYDIINFDKKKYDKLPNLLNNNNHLEFIRNNMDKVLYVTNINGARNYVLKKYLAKTDYLAVLDCNNFITENQYNTFNKAMINNYEYILSPIKRIKNYNNINNNIILNKLDDGEPQIIFKNTASLKFNESIPYGYSNKAELINLIGSKGIWNSWKDNESLNIKTRKTNNKYNFIECGYIIRLPNKNHRLKPKQYERSQAVMDLLLSI